APGTGQIRAVAEECESCAAMAAARSGCAHFAAGRGAKTGGGFCVTEFARPLGGCRRKRAGRPPQGPVSGTKLELGFEPRQSNQKRAGLDAGWLSSLCRNCGEGVAELAAYSAITLGGVCTCAVCACDCRCVS